MIVFEEKFRVNHYYHHTNKERIVFLFDMIGVLRIKQIPLLPENVSKYPLMANNRQRYRGLH
jgi:hypothetical protein